MGFAPGRGTDKVTRMHMVAPMFEAGVVWAPTDKKFTDEVIEEVASFPNGDHDDFCDSMTLAIMRFRQGGFVSLEGEDIEEDYVPSEKGVLLMALPPQPMGSIVDSGLCKVDYRRCSRS